MTMTPPPELREEVARVMWQAESLRARGAARLIPWAEETPSTQEAWLDLADAAIAAVLAWVDQEFVAIERLK